MAYVPDEAIDAMDEVSAGAFKLYTFLCRCRNGRTGQVNPSVATTADAISVHAKNIFRLRKELTVAGWVKFCGDSAELIKGYTSSKNATESSKNATPDGANKELAEDGSKNATQNAEISKNATQELQNCYSKVAKTLPNGSKNATRIYEQPAKEPAKRTMLTPFTPTPLPSQPTSASSKRGDEFSETETALLALMGWGLAPGQFQANQVRETAERLTALAAEYGESYTPTPERIARFPAYAKAQRFSTWRLNAVQNHWKNCVDWQTDQAASGGGESWEEIKKRKLAELDAQMAQQGQR